MRTFEKLFALPDVALYRALRSMKHAELFELSLLSDKARLMIKRANIKAFKVRVTFYTIWQRLELWTGSEEKSNLTLTFEPKQPVNKNQCSYLEILEEMKNTLEHLLDIFRFDTIDLITNWSFLNGIESIIRLPGIKKCSTLLMRGESKSPDDVDRLLTPFKSVGEFNFRQVFNNVLSKEKLSNVTHFNGGGSKWKMDLDFPSLFHCKSVRLECNQLTDVNGIIKKWLRSDEKYPIRQLEIEYVRSTFDELMDGIEWERWDGKRRPQVFDRYTFGTARDEPYGSQKDAAYARDVIRKSDGQVVSLSFNGNLLLIMFWASEY